MNLGDLLRLWVRLGVRIKLVLAVSRLGISAPDTQKLGCFSSNCDPISGQTDSRVKVLLKRKENSFRGQRRIYRGLLRCRIIIHVLVQEF